MARKKVKLAYIENDSARKTTFRKRKKGLMKKVSELSTLCGVDACAIVYSPYESAPEVWPSQAGVQKVLLKFKTMPEMEQSKKMVNQESFLKQWILKTNEQLKKLRRDNREKEITQVMFQCLVGRDINSLGIADLNDMDWMVNHYLMDIGKRIQVIGGQGSSFSSVAPAPAPASPSAQPEHHQGQFGNTIPSPVLSTHNWA